MQSTYVSFTKFRKEGLLPTLRALSNPDYLHLRVSLRLGQQQAFVMFA